MNLDELRRAVDEVDDALLALLKKRQTIASQIGGLKRGMGVPVYDPLREREILARLSDNNAGQLSEEAILSAWREIFSASRQAQKPLRAAYLGPEGTFTQQAALTAFGSSAELIATQTISAAFSFVTQRTVDFAVLPVENTLQGIVGETVDLLGAA
ncbi:MAG: chorismate mutase, partial [Planctomycetota bacterium]|nr:chorismate mutase [Planctomycetota bacterium]